MTMPMKRKLFFLLVLILALAAVVFVYILPKAGQSGQSMPEILGISQFLPESISQTLTKATETAQQLSPTKTTTDLSQQLSDTTEQLKETTGRSLEVAKHAGNVLGTAVSATNSTPLHERAIEYAQYTYCKQAVAEYEKLNGIE